MVLRTAFLALSVHGFALAGVCTSQAQTSPVGEPAPALQAFPSSLFGGNLEGWPTSPAFRGSLQDPTSTKDDAKKDDAKKDSTPKDAHQGFALFQVGVALLNPYKITRDPTTNKLMLDQKGGTDTNTFVEGLFRFRADWDGQEFRPSETNWQHHLLPAHFELRLGAVIGGNNEINGSAIAGGGDVYGEVALGWPVAHFTLDPVVKAATSKDTKDVHAASGVVDLGLLLGDATDRSAQNTHGYYGVGLAGTWRFAAGTETVQSSEVVIGGYLARVDVPKFVNGTSREIDTRQGDLPAYHMRTALALRGDMRIAVGDASYLTFTVRLFDGIGQKLEVKPWSVGIGYTVEISSLATALNKGVQALAGSSTKSN
jgi:hypothetical protein